MRYTFLESNINKLPSKTLDFPELTPLAFFNFNPDEGVYTANLLEYAKLISALAQISILVGLDVEKGLKQINFSSQEVDTDEIHYNHIIYPPDLTTCAIVIVCHTCDTNRKVEFLGIYITNRDMIKTFFGEEPPPPEKPALLLRIIEWLCESLFLSEPDFPYWNFR